MASIFTYDPDPPRVSSPWSTSGSSTPQPAAVGGRGVVTRSQTSTSSESGDINHLSDYGITKLDPEPQEGPTEYKLHLLLRPRRLYSSMSTGHLVAGSYHSRSSLPTSGSFQSSSEASPRPPQNPSSQSRQQRLQQLTTQLLWRLQQSSPFHSSSTANLVLPVLPEATPRLGVPSKPARLLPGLEESQGALYEIGVADDGTFVGLTEDELEESLTNLRAMAASLGCKVEVLRKVIVGNCEWAEDLHLDNAQPPKVHAENLWVAEALVSPDLEFYNSPDSKGEFTKLPNLNGQSADTSKETFAEDDCSRTEQIRISLVGPSAAGKSSLLGTLTTSSFDNGRGKSRLSLLKHRHEISSGITSSVAQELIGYGHSVETPASDIDVINYASGNIAAWNDIHAASEGGRLAFISDLPGLTRYVKSTVRGLVSWAPHYVILCVPANSSGEEGPQTPGGSAEQTPEIGLCLSYLELCIKLEVPILLAITKLDLASRTGLKQTLTKVLSALKVAGKKPHMLPVATGTADKPRDLERIAAVDSLEAKKIIETVDGDWSHTVPIILTSAVDGSGIGKLHALLRYLPIPKTPPARSLRSPKGASSQQVPTDVFDIDEVFAIPPSKVYSTSAERTQEENRGIVLCGIIRYGKISIGDELVVGPISIDTRTDDGGPQSTHRNRALHGSDHRTYSPPQPASFRSRPPSGEFSTSYGLLSSKSQPHVHGEWQRVRVVSVRNLRLPVRTLLEDQVGTIGVEPVPSIPGEDPPRLSRIRKGMILCRSRGSPLLKPSPDPIQRPLLPSFYAGFTATFPSRNFSSPLSPPLVLGGNAIIYTASIRTAARVTCVALAEQEMVSSPPSPTEPDFFSFDDGDDVDREGHSDGSSRRTCAERNRALDLSKASAHEDIKITFSFISSIEWVEVGSQLLVMPGAATSPAASGAMTGLEGFVGRICEVLDGEEIREK
ncbi:hypothetical protein VTN00DRAFT_4697 [Thermoascus crustaceus]|uniref:uncharacterized protein n=1 Tax=Thermoascus crustaceus TaxID=5088 RepID=UPI0037427367